MNTLTNDFWIFANKWLAMNNFKPLPEIPTFWKGRQQVWEANVDKDTRAKIKWCFNHYPSVFEKD